MVRLLAILWTFSLVCGTASAQGVVLAEQSNIGDCFDYEIALNVQGKLKVERNGKLEPLALTAAARHKFFERTEAPDARGSVGKVVRHYTEAKSESQTAGEQARRELSAARALIVALRTTTGTLHFSPAGPMTREELELTAEHFDTLCLPGLLPNKEVKVGETWPVGPEATQQACLLAGLIKAELVGKVTDISADVLTFTLTGPVEGVEQGATVKSQISATGKFSISKKRITELTWQQTDDRAQGAAGPAAEMVATITLKRSVLAEEPKTLDATARAAIPADEAAAVAMTQLRYVDGDGRYEFVYPREWHIVGRTADHLVIRLLDQGDFVAQATLTWMKRLSPGQRMATDDFKKLLAAIPNWQPEALGEDGMIPLADMSKQLYRLATRGKQDGAVVLQTFYLLSGSQGEQLAVTVLTPPDRANKIGTRDSDLVKAIMFKVK